MVGADSQLPTKGGFMKKNDIPRLNEQLDALAIMKDEDIDFSDIPEIHDLTGFKGISHITLVVRDLDKTSNFLCSVFDAKEVYSSGEKQFSLSKAKYFLIGDLWIALMEGKPLSERTYNHIAFQISEEDFELYAAKIKASGVELRPERPRVDGEGRSIYFYDFDNHLFELHTGTLEDRLNSYFSSEHESIPVEETDFWREMNANRVGNLLNAARLKQGMTQKQLAEKSRIKQNMISDYEKGRRRLTKQMASKFAEILKISPARLHVTDTEDIAR